MVTIDLNFPLENPIHDCMVLPAFRRKGGGRRYWTSVEAKARELGCCKLTFEVMGNNDRASVRYRGGRFLR